jgi:putative transposase
LLKFALDRQNYRVRIRQALKKHRVSILGYCLTSNHVHLTVWSENSEEISGFMQEVAGEFARDYNRRKTRSGAYWEGRYQATMVEGGVYFERCLVYGDLNMVRCGVVKHPREWEWCGYMELMGSRRRNRILDISKILELAGGAELENFRRNYDFLISERIQKDQIAREPMWTESLGVGSRGYVENLKPEIRNRMETVIEEDEETGWILKEAPVEYGSILVPKK